MSGFGAAPWGSLPWGAATVDSDALPPVIGAWAPASGSPIRRLDTIAFSVTDESGVVATVSARLILPTGVSETVYSSSGFGSLYSRGSARVAISNGYRFTLRRSGGWPTSSVRLVVTASDLAGNVANGQVVYL